VSGSASVNPGSPYLVPAGSRRQWKLFGGRVGFTCGKDSPSALSPVAKHFWGFQFQILYSRGSALSVQDGQRSVSMSHHGQERTGLV
jgi:hypothetical protein